MNKKELAQIASKDLLPCKALKDLYNVAGLKPENHINILTNHYFTGLNLYELELNYILNDYTTPEWATFAQFKADNKSIKKGEKATRLTLAVYKKQEEEKPEQLQFYKGYTVFNIAQVA